MKKSFAFLFVLFSCFSSIAIADIRYNITDLNASVGDTSYVFVKAINDHCQIVGHINYGSYNRAFFYDSVNGMKPLGTLGGNNSSALDINNNGQIVGNSSIDNTSVFRDRAFIYDSNATNPVMQNLGSLSNESDSTGDAINDNGLTVGWSQDQTFLYENINGMQSLGTFGGYYSVGNDINNSGQVVGHYDHSEMISHAFIYDSINGMHDLGTLGGDDSYAVAINNNGLVAGYSSNFINQSRAFIYDNAASTPMLRNLGTLGGNSSKANSLNDNGQVVGISNTTNGQNQAFIYDSINGMVNLNDLIDPESGWNLINAIDINSSGQIVGLGENPDGSTHSFLLTPVPEPATLTFIGLGATMIIRKRR